MIVSPALRPIVVDPFRGGGAFGMRHMFLGQTTAPAAPPPAAPVNVSSAQVSDIQKLIGQAVDKLNYELEAVGVESDLVSGSMLRTDPTQYQQIQDVGPTFSPQEVRSVILMDAQQLDALAARLKAGALSHYLSSEQQKAIGDVRTKAGQIVNFVEGQDLQAIQPGHESLAEQHTQRHTQNSKALVEKAEKMVVGAEAGAVPVKEPYEKTLGVVEIVAGVGVLAIVGVALWGLLP
jgi:hypothetical protein